MVRRADKHEVDLTEILQTLLKYNTRPNLRLVFKDGRKDWFGAVAYNERQGLGRVIDVRTEFSGIFNVYELAQAIYVSDEEVA